MSRGDRMRRVDSMLKQAIAEHVADLKDPRLGFVTITGVETSPDLRSARVFFSVLGKPEETSSSLEALTAAASKIRTEVGQEIRLKYTPSLAFVVDEAIERGAHIASILHEIEQEEAAAAGELERD
ncbi:MAG TPA: 30S ribosome-binding factor RbfA [Acidimicrobiia bacterium]|nr:30S ribosome-binding factor RbfA [Acidimicrobiia bacterium]